MPEGLTASAGAAGTSAIRSDIAALPNLDCYLVLPRNGLRNPSRQVAAVIRTVTEPTRVSGRKSHVLVETAIVVQRPTTRVEVALFGIEAMLLMPISPLTLTFAPPVVGRGRRRLAIHGSTDPLQDIARTLRVRRHCTQHEKQRKRQDRQLQHFT